MRRLAERGVEDDIGGLAPDAGQRFEQVAVLRHLAAVAVDEDLRGGDDVLRLGVEQADGLDVLAQRLLAKVEHLLRRRHLGEQARVALLTPTSVDCADSATATSSV